MKSGIHPTFYPDAVVTCACGNSWTTGSTKKEIHTDVCSNCHPFFTGEQRIVDTAGQVERFMKRISAKEQIAATQPAPEEKRSKKEKRRERRAGTPAPAPAPLQPPAELPLAAVAEEAPQAQAEPAPAPAPAPAAEVPETRAEAPETREEAAPAAQLEDTRVEEVAPAVTVEEVRPEENVIVPPAMQIGEAASFDKVVEVTEGGEREVAPLQDEKPAEPLEAPRGTEEVSVGGTAEVRDNVADVEMPGPAPERKTEAKPARKPRAPRGEAKPGEKPRSAPRKSAPSKPKKEQS